MKVSVTSIPLTELEVDLLVLPVAQDDAAEVLPILAGELGEALSRGAADFSGKPEEALLLYPEKARAKRILLVGMGPREALTLEQLRRVACKGAAAAEQRKAETVGLAMPETGLDAEEAAQALVEGFMLGAYRFLRYRTANDVFPGSQRFVLHITDAEKQARRGAERGRMIAEATNTARDLVNLSPHEKTPADLAAYAQRSAKKHHFTAEVWDKARIEREKMGGLLAVNRGSQMPPAFIILEWQPAEPLNERPIVLVGKGVVFDTGGLSLKPTKDSMDHMKADMAGAAAVIGALEATARLELPLHVVGLIPATDNRPGENAYVPGDVLTMHSGTTVEVLNTDAEGRLILADALSYAKNYQPEFVVDLATLTGAQVVAFGSLVAGLMTPETDGAEERIRLFVEAGRRSGDFVAPMPMLAAYAEMLKSDVADLKNIGGREAGAISAAKFLEHFTDYPWVHLDIAGPAFLHASRDYQPKGGTGFGVRILVEFLREYAKTKKKGGRG